MGRWNWRGMMHALTLVGLALVCAIGGYWYGRHQGELAVSSQIWKDFYAMLGATKEIDERNVRAAAELLMTSMELDLVASSELSGAAKPTDEGQLARTRLMRSIFLPLRAKYHNAKMLSDVDETLGAKVEEAVSRATQVP